MYTACAFCTRVGWTRGRDGQEWPLSRLLHWGTSSCWRASIASSDSVVRTACTHSLLCRHAPVRHMSLCWANALCACRHTAAQHFVGGCSSNAGLAPDASTVPAFAIHLCSTECVRKVACNSHSRSSERGAPHSAWYSVKCAAGKPNLSSKRASVMCCPLISVRTLLLSN